MDESGVVPPVSGMLDRIEAILDSFDSHGRQTLSEVADNTGLPKSTTHRLLAKLVQRRWLTESGHEYELGDRLVEYGSRAIQQSTLHSVAVPVLERLRRATGHVVHLGALDGEEVIYTYKTDVPEGYVLFSHVGGRKPIARSPIGHALLAQSVVPRCLPPRLDKVRRDGIAYVRNRVNCGVGTTIVSAGRPVAGLSVCGPVDLLSPESDLIRKVKDAAQIIGESIPTAELRVTPVLQERQHKRARNVAASASAEYASGYW
ncbi:IclR family transcriptional regulator [Tomitella gaofuii]|uniref:IclR family transcriptional regulator n=1 Tax=Tomitella gaofuii TaxID=2760083 RepID=UPI0015FE5733|nr:helix-turn-helix domain-containing protein [Tomitella gaofuii]